MSTFSKRDEEILIDREIESDPYTRIPNAMWHEGSLSTDAKAALTLALTCPPDWKLNVTWLGRKLKFGRNKTYRAINDLIAHGYCSRNQEKLSAGVWGRMRYAVRAVPKMPQIVTASPKQGRGDKNAPRPQNGYTHNGEALLTKYRRDKDIVQSVGAEDRPPRGGAVSPNHQSSPSLLSCETKKGDDDARNAKPRIGGFGILAAKAGEKASVLLADAVNWSGVLSSDELAAALVCWIDQYGLASVVAAHARVAKKLASGSPVSDRIAYWQTAVASEHQQAAARLAQRSTKKPLPRVAVAPPKGKGLSDEGVRVAPRRALAEPVPAQHALSPKAAKLLADGLIEMEKLYAERALAASTTLEVANV